MKCPLCDTEANISSATNVFKNNKLFRKYEYSCRNKNCANYGKVIGEEENEVPVIIE